MDEFNMYEGFIDDNTFATLPFFNIPQGDNDAYVEWSVSSRLDKIAYTYYDNAAIWKLILLANKKICGKKSFFWLWILCFWKKCVYLYMSPSTIRTLKKFEG